MAEKPTYEELEQRIKELEQTETELKRSEALFRGLFANMTSGSAIYEVLNDGSKGSDYIVKEFNNKSLEIEGKLLEQVIGKTLFELRPNIDDYGLISAMKKVWETGLPAYHPVKLYKDNNFSNYYENYIFKIPSGEIVTIYNDITIQKNQELALQESKERFELAMKFTNDGLFDWNLETNQIHYSSGWKRMLGYSDDEVKDEFSEWERLTKFEDMKASWDMLNEVLEGKRGHFEKEFKMQHKDGHWVDILSRANVVFNEDGKGVRVVGTHVDITARKQAEMKQKELEAINLRLQKAESLSQMAGGIAHLFNNYLYAVSGNLELALEELSDDSLIRYNLTEAMKAARRCADVSGSMLTYLGQSVVKTESVDISELCRKNLSTFQSQSSANIGITIETDLVEAELFVRVNTHQMQQVLNHLITNACESIGENKGRISLITRTIRVSEMSGFHLLPVDCKPSANTYACVEVSDTGCGISKEDIHRLFDPFFTTKFTGRGLGLSVVLGTVKSWGGMIGVKSEIGHGSSFMVFLPLAVDAPIYQTEKLSQSLKPKEFPTLLIVDDNQAVLKMTTIMLKKMGFEVISAVNGVDAVKKFRQHKESISCLITDLSMPELDGWGTLTEIRKINPSVPAILASGYDEAFAMSRDTSEKPQAFLHKPYSMSDLKGALGTVLGSLAPIN